MDEIIERYKQGKFQKCLELIKLLPPTDNIVDNFILQNCFLVVEPVLQIVKNKIQNASETEKKLYSFFDSVTSLNILDPNIALQLKLIATYNYFWWILFFTNIGSNIKEDERCINKIYLGLIKVAGDGKFLTSNSTMSEKIFNQLCALKNFMNNTSCFLSLLIIEIDVIVLLIILKLSREMFHEFIYSAKFFLSDLKAMINLNEFERKNVPSDFEPLNLFKFDLNKLATVLSSMDCSIIDYLQFIESVLFYDLGKFEESLKLLQNNIRHNFLPLWNYLKALNFYKLNRADQCLKYLRKISDLDMEPHLKMEIFMLKGKLYCKYRNYKKSLKHFEKALNLKINSPLPYFYIGQQYGKMGLYEIMAEWFEKLFQIVKEEKKEIHCKYNIETILLECIHGSKEITETEVLYILAISKSLNEKFNEASNAFEEIFQSCTKSTGLRGKVIHISSWLTVLHEASIINVLAGNLTRAEEIASDAINQYSPQEISLIFRGKKSRIVKDIYWLETAIEDELLGNKIYFETVQPQFFYVEDFLFFLPQNIIALLIRAEIQKIQGLENYKLILKKIFSCLSDYIALIIKKQKLDETEKCICTIVKALTSKICLSLVNAQISNSNLTYIEKMLKRALNCNKGDKDVFYYYCDFLFKNGKTREASKLWNTYCDEKTSIPLECIQSLSLRYFLTTKITKTEMEKIQKKINVFSIVSKK